MLEAKKLAAESAEVQWRVQYLIGLIKTGLRSHTLDWQSRRDRTPQNSRQKSRTIFVAIAFVARFSERLVRDVVIKTEDALAGPASGRDRW